MMPRTLEIGFSSQRLRYEWVQHTASLGLAGLSGEMMADELGRYLCENLSSAGTGERGSREKAITILKRIWSPGTKELQPLRDDGFGLLRNMTQKNHLAVHWGMTTASYPFWSATGTCVGRLLRLQGSADSVQIRRRMQEIYGDREIIARATRNVVRSFIDWGVLKEKGLKGVYAAGMTLAVDDSRLIAWLVEASLHARANGSAPLKDILNSPSLFPFRVKPIHAESLVAASSRLDILRHGLDDDLVMLRSRGASKINPLG